MKKRPIEYVLFNDHITPESSGKLMRFLSSLAKNRTPEVYLVMSTPGGNTAAGMTLYNFLNSMPFQITVHNIGSVNSMGNAVFLTADQRYACDRSTFMFHGVGFDRPAGRYEEKELRQMLDSIYADQKLIGDIITSKTNFSDAEVAELFREARTLTSDSACTKGIVHAVQEFNLPSGAILHAPCTAG